MMSDPAERHIVGDLLPIVPENAELRYGGAPPIVWHLYRVLRRAYEENEPWFVPVRPVGRAVTIQEASKPPRPRPAILVITDDAGRYIAADPRTRELLPPSYVAFLEAGGHAKPYPAGSAPESTAGRPTIGEQNLPTASAADASDASTSGSATAAPGCAAADPLRVTPVMERWQSPQAHEAEGDVQSDETLQESPIAAMRHARAALISERRLVLPMEKAVQHRAVLEELNLNVRTPPRGYGYETFRSKVAVGE